MRSRMIFSTSRRGLTPWTVAPVYSPLLSSIDFASAWCAIVGLFAVGATELLDYWYNRGLWNRGFVRLLRPGSLF